MAFGRAEECGPRHPISTSAPLALAVEGFRRNRPRPRDEVLIRLRQRFAVIAKSVRHGITAIAAEIPAGDLDAWRCLPPLVFGDVQQTVDPRDDVAVKVLSDDRRQRLLPLNQPLKDRVEQIIGRQRFLIGLVFAQLRRRRPGAMMLTGITSPDGPSAPSGFHVLRRLDSRNTSVL